MSTNKKTREGVEFEKINQDVIRSALDTTVYSVRCRCDFNQELSVKINKDNIRADVEETLAKLGLSIDKEVITLQHVKVLKNKQDPSVFQYVLISLKIHDDKVAEKMESGVFASGATVPGNKTSGFTVQWPGRETNNTSKPRNDSKKDTPEPQIVEDSKEDDTIVLAESRSGGQLLYTLAALAVVGASTYWLMKRHSWLQ